SAFNKIAKSENWSSLTLANDEAFVIDGNTRNENTDYFKNRKVKFTFGDKVQELTIKGEEIRRLTNFGELVLVVPDQIYNSAKQVGKTRIVKNINLKDEKNSSVLTEKLQEIMPVTDPTSSVSKFESFYMEYHIGLMINGLFIFCGFFLGVVFLLATGSIIYFK
ncbi:ABC transporter permease, partial [Bacillus mycoides]|nr:ABC transporter permease [Bacillus mycoides]